MGMFCIYTTSQRGGEHKASIAKHAKCRNNTDNSFNLYVYKHSCMICSYDWRKTSSFAILCTSSILKSVWCDCCRSQRSPL